MSTVNGVDVSQIPATVEDAGQEHGIDWCVMRHTSFGFCNGYVRLPERHPWRDETILESLTAELCHGGITGGHGDDWIGFDTGHAFDYWPGTPLSEYEDPEHPWTVHWTVAKVADEARRLARHVAEAVTS